MQENMKDEIFKTDSMKVFSFDEGVSAVFDDMAKRSIPYYQATLDLISDFSLSYLPKNHARLYDLGSSTGNLLIEIALKAKALQHESLELIGLDSSTFMTERAMLKAKAVGIPIIFQNADILQYDFLPAHAFICHYTIQFIPPNKRLELLKNIYHALVEKGIFIMSEKIETTHDDLNQKMIQRYYHYKKTQGYSLSEIAKKREALENVLIPYTHEQNIALLKEAGFSWVECLFRWVNFETLIAFK